MLNHDNDTLRNIGLQFFAEGGPEGSEGAEGTEGSQGKEEGQGTGSQSGKTFSQEDVNRLLKAEKESAKKALLKELGVEDAKSAKEGLTKYKEILEKDKTETQKAQDTATQATKDKEAAEARALLAEAKVEVLSAGCKPEYLEDVITLALKRVTEDNSLADVVKEMKEDSKYAAFFGGDGSGSGDKGTGGGSGYKKQQGSDKKGSLGSRLGKQVAQTNSKNPYFNN